MTLSGQQEDVVEKAENLELGSCVSSGYVQAQEREDQQLMEDLENHQNWVTQVPV